GIGVKRNSSTAGRTSLLFAIRFGLRASVVGTTQVRSRSSLIKGCAPGNFRLLWSAENRQPTTEEASHSHDQRRFSFFAILKTSAFSRPKVCQSSPDLRRRGGHRVERRTSFQLYISVSARCLPLRAL